jgi:hypothetical protein
MDKIIYPAGAVLSFVAFVYKFLGLRRDPRNSAMRALVASLGGMCAGFLFITPWVYTAFDSAVGVPNLARLLTHVSVMFLTAAMQRWLLFWVYEPDEVRRRGRIRLVVFCLSVAAMTALFIAAPVDEDTVEFSTRYPDAPFVAEYMIVYLTYFGISYVDVARLCWKYSNVTSKPFLRRGLRISAVGSMGAVGYCLEKAFYVLCRNLDVTPFSSGVQEAASPILGGGGAILVVTGLTLPAWGPGVSWVYQTVGRWRAYRGLGPLWRAVYDVLPGIALDHPPRTFGSDLGIRDVEYRVLRRVVEIRDARLGLRPYLDSRMAARARCLGERAGLVGEDLRAVIEAAMLAGAIRAKRSGTPRPGDAPPGEPVPAGGDDLASETAWWVRVSRAFVSSAVVAAALSERSEPDQDSQRLTDPV